MDILSCIHTWSCFYKISQFLGHLTNIYVIFYNNSYKIQISSFDCLRVGNKECFFFPRRFDKISGNKTLSVRVKFDKIFLICHNSVYICHNDYLENLIIIIAVLFDQKYDFIYLDSIKIVPLLLINAQEIFPISVFDTYPSLPLMKNRNLSSFSNILMRCKANLGSRWLELMFSTTFCKCNHKWQKITQNENCLTIMS